MPSSNALYLCTMLNHTLHEIVTQQTTHKSTLYSKGERVCVCFSHVFVLICSICVCVWYIEKYEKFCASQERISRAYREYRATFIKRSGYRQNPILCINI